MSLFSHFDLRHFFRGGTTSLEEQGRKFSFTFDQDLAASDVLQLTKRRWNIYLAGKVKNQSFIVSPIVAKMALNYRNVEFWETPQSQLMSWPLWKTLWRKITTAFWSSSESQLWNDSGNIALGGRRGCVFQRKKSASQKVPVGSRQMISAVGITPGCDSIASSAALGRMFLFQDSTGGF